MHAVESTEHAEIVTIVAATRLWRRLQVDLVRLGVRRYTFMSVSGFEPNRRLEGSFLIDANVRIETRVSPDILQAILAHAIAHYTDFELTAYTGAATSVQRLAGA